jgi:hypothetical protein
MPEASLYDLAYPPKLREAEQRLLNGRAPAVGVAVSGGGIRSATFALGVFQALAELKALRHIDCLSTVSGGGYFGAFLGRLFSRDYIKKIAHVEWVLTGPHASPYHPKDADESDSSPTLHQAGWKVLGWLRENGRYLAPRGAGDLLLGGAVLLRNWLSIHVVLFTSLLAVFLLLQAPRVLFRYLSEQGRVRIPELSTTAVSYLPASGTWIWWSPWILPGLALFALAVPPAWAYWLVGGDRWDKSLAGGTRHHSGTAGAVVAMIIGILALAVKAPEPHRTIALVFGVAGASAALCCLGAFLWALRKANKEKVDNSSKALFCHNKMRYDLSAWFKKLLLAAALVTGIALIDSLGQTVYALHELVMLRPWFTAILAFVTTIGATGHRIVALLGLKPQGGRPRLPVSMAAAVVAFVVVVTLIAGVDMLSHAIVWNFQQAAAPQSLGPPSKPGVVAASITTPTLTASLSAVAGPSVPGLPRGTPRPSRRVFFAWLIATAALAAAFGHAFTFLNQSSHQPLYCARLTRAYLGASNDLRWTGQPVPVIDPVAGDDIEVHKYWTPPPLGADVAAPAASTTPAKPTLHDKGMPLHFVNVTINETYDSQSQVQQQDRKGTGMALGPAGMSVGIRHHVVLRQALAATPDAPHPRVVIDEIDPPEDTFQAFKYILKGQETEFPWEPLSFGRWIGISGAAFSTGTGYRTSLGLSLLAGMGNVRLGYWWDSAANVESRSKDDVTKRHPKWTRWITRLFPVQAFLLAEFVARFPGTAHKYWYLTDGGHFENMGGYELIRRQLPFIVIIDAEADPDYTFEGLANLVRKARLDFQTEITFLGSVGAQTAFDRLRPIDDAGASKDDPGRLRRSPARYAIADIKYPGDGGARTGKLLYIKPVLLGDEPADVLQYARANPPFPQQTTADQFFDEAQWESYRRLGQYIAKTVLTETPSSGTESVLQMFGLARKPPTA